jgi:hypothetical protein
MGLVAGAALVVALAAGCSTAQRQALGEQDARDSLSARVERAITGQGLGLDGKLQCSATIADAGQLTSKCTGQASSAVPVEGTFDGTADVHAETCNAHLVVTLDGAAVVDQTGIDCFATP